MKQSLESINADRDLSPYEKYKFEKQYKIKAIDGEEKAIEWAINSLPKVNIKANKQSIEI